MNAGVVLAERYRLGPLIGRGGAAEVFRAQDLVGDEPVAVKLFPAEVSDVDSRRQQREIDSLASLHHPGLVALRHSGELTGRRYLVMDLVDGMTLRDRLLDAPMPHPWVVGLGAALADALAYIHGRGVVHRDVKPTNVLLDEQDRPRLADFGLAQLSEATRMTASGLISGTPAYLAPEQVRGDLVGAAADVYAFGLVLLECLTGRCEYPGAPVEAAVARLHRAPGIPEPLPAWLRLLLTELTAQDPARRPSAAKAAAALRREHFDLRPTTPLSISMPLPLRRGVRSRAVAVGATVAAGLLVGAVALGAGRTADSAAPAPDSPTAPALVGPSFAGTAGSDAGAVGASQLARAAAVDAPVPAAAPARSQPTADNGTKGRGENGKGKGKGKSDRG